MNNVSTLLKLSPMVMHREGQYLKCGFQILNRILSFVFDKVDENGFILSIKIIIVVIVVCIL